MVLFREALHQTLAATTVNFNEFMIGIGYGWIAPILVRLHNAEGDFVPTNEESSWIASLHEVGRIFGPLFSAVFLDNIGRKYTIIICSFLFFITWFILIFARSIKLIYTLRFLFGVTIGMNDVSSSIYLAENCSPNLRGIVGSFIPLSFYAGIFVEYILATYLSYTTVAVVNTVVGFVALLTIYNLKETPYFLVMKGQHEAAENNLIWLKGNDVCKNEVALELDTIKQNIQTEKLKRTSISGLFASPENYRTLFIVLVVYLLIMATGYSGINSYVSTVFHASNTFTSNEYAILLGIIQFLAVCISPFIMERYNRRTLILISFVTMALCHASTFIFYQTSATNQSAYFPWLIFASITVYSIIFAMIYPAVYIIRGELLPMSVKAVGGCLAIVVNSFAGFATARLFPTIAKCYGIEYNFLIYFTASALGFVYIYFMLPETRGKSLIDIQRSLKNI